MKTKKILEWINGELTNQEIEDLKNQIFLYWKKSFHSEHLQAPAIDAEAALARFNQLKLKKGN
jgi:hypothetical protein